GAGGAGVGLPHRDGVLPAAHLLDDGAGAVHTGGVARLGAALGAGGALLGALRGRLYGVQCGASAAVALAHRPRVGRDGVAALPGRLGGRMGRTGTVADRAVAAGAD